MLLLRAASYVFIPLVLKFWVCSGDIANDTLLESPEIHDQADASSIDINVSGKGLHLTKDRSIKITTFREIVIRSLLYNRWPYAHPLGMATSLILSLVKSNQQQSAWEQVKSRVKAMVHETMDDNNIALLSNLWNQIDSTLKLKRSLTAVKIKKVLDLSPRFFPHNYPVAQWTVTWPQTMMRYFSSLLAMYMDLQAKQVNGGIEPCEWLKIWKSFRGDIIEASKVLARERWKVLRGTNWHGGTMWAVGGKRYGRFSYKDGITGRKYSKVATSRVKDSVLQKVNNDLKRYLFEHFGTKFNALNVEVQKPVPTYSVQKNSSRCKGSDDKTEYRGKVRTLATCAALCNGVSKYFSIAKHYEASNRKCSPHAGLHLCECYCEVGDTCEEEADEDFDAFAFDSGKAYKWGPVRDDGKCGSGIKADCDPKSSWGPCCSPYNMCGISDDHCKCEGCVDFRADEKAFQKIGAATYCDGDNTWEGYKAGLDACAQACKGKKAELFNYGTDEYGEPRCKGDKCACYCYMETVNSRCKEEKIHYGYDLYAFEGKVTEKRCSRGAFLTPNDFDWPFPENCFGHCKSEFSTDRTRSDTRSGVRCNPPSNLIEHPCDLPCLSYHKEPSERHWCVIRGGYTSSWRIFDRDYDCYDCDECELADWKTCYNSNWKPIQKPKPNYMVLYGEENKK